MPRSSEPPVRSRGQADLGKTPSRTTLTEASAESTATTTSGTPAPKPLDLSIERLEAHDGARWKGRRLSDLSDAELGAAAASREVALPPPEVPNTRRERNWLKLRVTWPQPRHRIALDVDESVLEWFSRQGPGGEERMNAVLRAYVDAQLDAEAHAK